MGRFQGRGDSGPGYEEEKNVVWLKRNDNIIGGRDCSGAIMNIVRTPDLEDHLLVIDNKHLLSTRATGIFYDWFSPPDGHLTAALREFHRLRLLRPRACLP